MASVHHTASVAATAVVTGDVTLGPGARVLSGAVLNGDLGPVRIGEDVVVMEHALLRGRPPTRSRSATPCWSARTPT
jgi:carbonic anhydrase/acetyltransferase-like protein (isoleucine patch superfamily)